MSKLSALLKEADIRINDLENHSRRNNIVLFSIPEGFEGPDCGLFVTNLLKQCNISEAEAAKSIQRAHRSGRAPAGTDTRGGSPALPRPRPRPIHVAFSSYVEKEKFRKGLITLFKEKKFGLDNTYHFYVSDDFSRIAI